MFTFIFQVSISVRRRNIYSARHEQRRMAHRQQATEADWLTRARLIRCAEVYKTRQPSFVPVTLEEERENLGMCSRSVLASMLSQSMLNTTYIGGQEG